MATSKHYAYYLEGNQLAIVEKDVSFDNDVNSKDYGPGASKQRWESPQTTVTDGLEIKYTYPQTYRLNTYSSTQINKFYVNGWTVIDGYLTFLRSHSASVPSWDASPYSTVGDDEYISVNGSSRWNGIHKVQTTGTDGTLKTYTKVNQSVATVIGSSSIDITAEEDSDSDGVVDRSRIAANNSSGIWLNNVFSTGNYIFVSGSAQAVNNGFWKVSDVQASSSNEIDSGIYIRNRYYCATSGNSLDTEVEDTIPDTYATYDESVKIYKAYRDFCYIQADITVMQDESFELDLPSYLQKALIYYVKAKAFEDGQDIEGREFAMREFKKMIEKHDNSRIRGLRIMSPGSHAIR